VPERREDEIRLAETRLAQGRALAASRIRPAEGRAFVGGLGSPAALKFAKVTARKNASNEAWTDFDTDGFISHVTANPCDAGGGSIDTETILCLKATEAPATASMGFEKVGYAQDVVGYLPGDGTEVVPGAATFFDGYLVPNAGKDGAVMTARVVD